MKLIDIPQDETILAISLRSEVSKLISECGINIDPCWWGCRYGDLHHGESQLLYSLYMTKKSDYFRKYMDAVVFVLKSKCSFFNSYMMDAFKNHFENFIKDNPWDFKEEKLESTKRNNQAVQLSLF